VTDEIRLTENINGKHCIYIAIKRQDGCVTILIVIITGRTV